MFGLFLLFWAIFLLLSLTSFDANDPSINVVKSGALEINNKAGLFGSYTAGLLNDFFGVGAIFIPFIFGFLGIAYISTRFTMHWWRWCGFFILSLSLLTFAAAIDLSLGDLAGGGVTGKTLYLFSNHYLSPTGSLLLWIFITLIGLQLSGNFSWINLLSRSWNKYKKILSETHGDKFTQDQITKYLKSLNERLGIVFQKIKDYPSKKLSGINSSLPPLQLPVIASEEQPYSSQEKNPVTQDITPVHEQLDNIRILSPTSEKNEAELILAGKEASAEDAGDFQWESFPENTEIQLLEEEENIEPQYEFHEPEPQQELILPSLDLLTPPGESRVTDNTAREHKGSALMQCLEDFDIKGKLARITPGPVVTMYEVRPEPGVRVSKIMGLVDDLSLALKAVSVRIQPIPGSDTVGIEISNDEREMVNFRELAETDQFQQASGPLTMILGKDIAGRPYMADLSKMPHLLVAGATGAGKSVCLNSILISMLYRLQPRDLRLLLVDPKRIEMAVYADLPHLIHPVVTEMEDAKNALEWALQEMDNRYKALGRLGARNMASYNQKLAAMGTHRLPEHEDLKHLPYLVIVIDELADLMMTAAREAQTSILRLAQLARAAGIHMILATQRPSVDVVTGLIKANFLNRISFQVTSKHDSRTILDQTGAEYLLGKGDMLYKPSSGRLLRLHGPFLSDEEVAAVANHWKRQMAPEYEIDFSQWGENASIKETDPDSNYDDPLYDKVKAFVLEQGKASISMLQRHFSVGFGRSGRMIAQLEREGIIGPADGSKPRNVLR